MERNIKIIRIAVLIAVTLGITIPLCVYWDDIQAWYYYPDHTPQAIGIVVDDDYDVWYTIALVSNGNGGFNPIYVWHYDYDVQIDDVLSGSVKWFDTFTSYRNTGLIGKNVTLYLSGRIEING